MIVGRADDGGRTYVGRVGRVVVIGAGVDDCVGHQVTGFFDVVCSLSALSMTGRGDVVPNCDGFQPGHVVCSWKPSPGMPFSPTVVMTGAIGVTGAGGREQLPMLG